jgi:hypothetical protein
MTGLKERKLDQKGEYCIKFVCMTDGIPKLQNFTVIKTGTYPKTANMVKACIYGCGCWGVGFVECQRSENFGVRDAE